MTGIVATSTEAGEYTFSGYETVPAGLVPEDFVLVDLNGDGFLDLAVANTRAFQPAGVEDETVSVYLNLGDGTLAPAVEYAVGDRPEGIAAGDLDGDGIVDLATANFQGESVSLLFANEGAVPGVGDGTFTPGAPLSVPGGPRGVAAADLNSDGITDLVTANYNAGTVSVLQGLGGGSFDLVGSFSVGSGPEVVAVGFFNDDEVLDLATCDSLVDTVTVLAGDGELGFSVLESVAVGDLPRHLRGVDLDADGVDEIIVANHRSNTVTVLKDPDGTGFAPATSVATSGMVGPVYTAVADLDADGVADLVVSYAFSRSIVVYPGVVGGGFGPGQVLPTGENPLGVGAGDLDLNGHADVVVTNALDHSVLVYRGSASPGGTVVDNDSPDTFSTGSWVPSTGTDPYDGGSVYSKDAAGATFGWNAGLSPGWYAVHAWWSFVGSRTKQAPYTVVHSGAASPTSVLVNQHENEGRWNLLGRFPFDETGTVRVSSTSSAESTCADAVYFVPILNGGESPEPPQVLIDPNSSVSGNPVTLSAESSDPDGTVLRFEWTSDIDGLLGFDATIVTTTLSVGTHTVTVRAQDDSGTWSGTSTTTATVSATEPTGGVIVIDNGDLPGTSFTGTWPPSSGPAPYDGTSLYSRDGATYTYDFILPVAGTYQVFAWWTSYPSRTTAARYEIQHSTGTAVVERDQQLDGGGWRPLGTYAFGARALVTIRAVGSATTCADAIAVELITESGGPPTAEILEVSPNPAQVGTEVSFSGDGSDPDGDTIAAYRWSSDRDGPLSSEPSFVTQELTVGVHSITFQVQDSTGLWSVEQTTPLEITPADGMRILDDGELGTSFEGTWTPSGGLDPYGSRSLYARNGPTYTYRFPLAEPGTYAVFAWWTVWSSRSTAVPYEVTYSGGTAVVPKSQQIGGDQWNPIGTYYFETEAVITIRAVGSSTTCADAVAIAPVAGNAPPRAEIVEIAPSPAVLGQEVTLTGYEDDPDGTVVAREWTSSLDGPLSAELSFATTSLSLGTHEISLRVRDDLDLWSPVATATLEVRSDVERILDNGDPGTTPTGTWTVSGGTDPYGTNSVYAKGSGFYTYTFTGLTPGRYRVHASWTVWPSRSTAVPIEIRHIGGPTTVPVNQRTRELPWNFLAEVEFGDTAVVVIHVDGSLATLTTCADAIKLEKVP